MKVLRHGASAAVAMLLAHAPAAHSASPVPPFDVAYRAWEIVTELARQHRDPAISGECARTFRPFVIPALRRQTRQEQDTAAQACVTAARSACASSTLRRSEETGRKCEEFK
ncbi:MAG TPA: hypothetical protein VFM98_16290 [Ramlibacter sp.]|uniref:hypothetical protein n=1 Tax=Ramlibacter sp. TaxID=1917967 RepID=UPI002D7EBC83|nr:hypothetical protein [Ramlibacter sp.]HET8747159.1 hypothetical protein [Ramlibacter sp.]